MLSYIIAFYLSVILGLSKTPFVLGYRMGESIDTEITINGLERSSPVRNLLPKFGMKWEKAVRFEKNNVLGVIGNEEIEEVKSLSFQFEDGLWVLPTLSLTKRHYIEEPDFLNNVVFEFVITKSGIGTIHSVAVKDAVYSKEHKPYFHVNYEWVEEKSVSPSAGHAVMFLLVFLCSIYFLLVSCGVVTTDYVSDKNYRFHENTSDQSQQLSVPKFD